MDDQINKAKNIAGQVGGKVGDEANNLKNTAGQVGNEVGNEVAGLKNSVGNLFHHNQKPVPAAAPSAAAPGKMHKGAQMMATIVVTSTDGSLSADQAAAKVKAILDPALAKPTASGLTSKVTDSSVTK